MFSFFKRSPTPGSPFPLKLFNTESRTLEEFVPRNPKQVTLYSCGPTVYDYVHLGNLRALILADIVKRTLLFNGYRVKNTINLTDFGHLTDDGDAGDDKMMKGLKREGKPVTLAAMRELSDVYIEAFIADLHELRVTMPTTFSRASDYVHEQIQLIKTLEEKGYTYGIYSSIVNMHRASYTSIGADVKKEFTQQTLDEIKKEIHILHTQLIPDEELERVRNYMLGSLAGNMTTAFDLVEVFKGIHFSEMTYAYYTDYVKTIQTIPPEELQNTARQYLRHDDMVEVIVGGV